MARRKPAPVVPCVGADGAGCPRPGCPGSAEPTVVYRPDAAPVVRDLCHWCWIAERETFVLPCSACGDVPDYVREHTRWWHLYSPHGMVKDSCARCLRPLPGACMDCTASDGWTALTAGWLPDRPGDCTCWRKPDQLPRGATARDVLDLMARERREASGTFDLGNAADDDHHGAMVEPDDDDDDDDDDDEPGDLVEPATAPAPETPAFIATGAPGVQLDMFGAAAIACPHCGSRRTFSDDANGAAHERRAYTCDDCRRTWSVDGAQLDLLADLGAPPPRARRT